MGDVIEFKQHQPATAQIQDRYQLFKNVLREYMEEHEVAAVIAAVHDPDCYQRSLPMVQKIVDHYLGA